MYIYNFFRNKYKTNFLYISGFLPKLIFEQIDFVRSFSFPKYVEITTHRTVVMNLVHSSTLKLLQ